MEDEINILDYLFASRKESFDEIYYKKYRRNEDILELIDDIRLMIKHKINDKILQKKLLEKLNRYDELLYEETYFRHLQFYKLGCKDAVRIIKEIK